MTALQKERLYQEALHREAQLRIEKDLLLKALQAVTKDAANWLKDAGGCDHSVGICMCAEVSNLEQANAAISKATAV